MLTGVRFSALPRDFVPILDVRGELVIENPTQDSTRQLLTAAVVFIKKAERFNGRIYDNTVPPISKYKHVYFSLIFRSNSDMKNFWENLCKK